MAEKKGIKLLVSIVERGQGKNVVHFLSEHKVACNFQSVGRGTASSDLMDVLGLGSTERDITISLGEKELVRQVMHQIQDDDNTTLWARGIIFSMPLTAMSTLAAAAIMKQNNQESAIGGVQMQQSMEEDHSLILIVVNQGHTDEVMNTARTAGARGGTIVRSRWAGSEETEAFYGITLQEEKEIIAIVAGGDRRKMIMETVNLKHGINSPAGAMLCAVGIDDMQRF